MEVATREVEEGLIVDLFGPFPDSGEERHALRDTIREAFGGHSGPIIINLRDVRFIRSTDIGVLVGAIHKAAEIGATFSIVSTNEGVRSVFNVGDGLFRTYETEDDALRAQRSSGGGSGGCALEVAACCVLLITIVVWIFAV